jgi:ABC-type nickel/cobalt efflux system permease component RcnA
MKSWERILISALLGAIPCSAMLIVYIGAGMP